MEVKQSIVLEIKKGDAVFSFIMPSGSTWGDAINASYEVLQQISKMSQENVEKLKPVEKKDE